MRIVWSLLRDIWAAYGDKFSYFQIRMKVLALERRGFTMAKALQHLANELGISFDTLNRYYLKGRKNREVSHRTEKLDPVMSRVEGYAPSLNHDVAQWFYKCVGKNGPWRRLVEFRYRRQFDLSHWEDFMKSWFHRLTESDPNNLKGIICKNWMKKTQQYLSLSRRGVSMDVPVEGGSAEKNEGDNAEFVDQLTSFDMNPEERLGAKQGDNLTSSRSTGRAGMMDEINLSRELSPSKSPRRKAGEPVPPKEPLSRALSSPTMPIIRRVVRPLTPDPKKAEETPPPPKVVYESSGITWMQAGITPVMVQKFAEGLLEAFEKQGLLESERDKRHFLQFVGQDIREYLFDRDFRNEPMRALKEYENHVKGNARGYYSSFETAQRLGSFIRGDKVYDPKFKRGAASF